MKTLILIRHAKSDWGDAATADHDRELAPRGLRDAPVMAARLREHLDAAGTPLQRIVSSTAVRARTTAEFFGATAGVPVDLDRSLYGAGPEVPLRVASRHPDADVLAVVAHNPGLTMLAYDLSSLAPGEPIGEMPTCAVAAFAWPDADDWSLIDALPPAVWFAAPGR